MDNQPTNVRHRRRRTPHTRTGCFTCKIRRVKCDEQRPTCQRCKKFGVVCDGYPARKIVPPVPATHLKPSNVICPSIQTTLFDSAMEKNSFDFWHRIEVSGTYGSLDSAVWKQLIFRSSCIPSIRYCIAAIGALELVFADAHGRPISSSIQRQDSTNIYHRAAIKFFDKAIKQMRADTEANNQSLRTTIMTCILIHWFESFHGNYQLAVAQIRTGEELVSEWRANLLRQASQTDFPSPAPAVIEDELVQAIGNLAIQTFHNPDPKSQGRKRALQQESIEMERCMPSTFTSIKQARPYLESIIKNIPYVLVKTNDIPTESATPSSSYPSTKSLFPSTNSKEQTAALAFLSNECNMPVGGIVGTRAMEASTEDVPSLMPSLPVYEDPAAKFQVDKGELEELHAKLQRWHRAFKKMPGHQEIQVSVNRLLLQLHYKACVFALDNCLLDPMAFDLFRKGLLEIVTLSSRILDELGRIGERTIFIPDMGVIQPLYLAGINCRFPSIRARIINLLLRQSRREGVWDSIFVGKVVAWVRDLEEVYLEGEGDDRTVPQWARVEFITTDFDMLKRTVKVSCLQKTSPEDLVRRKKEAVLAW